MLIEQKELKTELQTRYDDAKREHDEAKANDAEFTKTFYHGLMVACIRIAEDFNIKLDK